MRNQGQLLGFGNEEKSGWRKTGRRTVLGEEIENSVSCILSWLFLSPSMLFPLGLTWSDSSCLLDLISISRPRKYLP